MLQFVNIATPSAPPNPVSPGRGVVTIDQVTEGAFRLMQNGAGGMVDGMPSPLEPARQLMYLTFRPTDLWAGTNLKSLTPTDFAAATTSHLEYLAQVFTIAPPVEDRKAISTQEVKAAVLLNLNPASTVSRAVLSSVQSTARGPCPVMNSNRS
jgi:hypothetical protein